MNSFSLRPRLLILVHKGRQLLSTLRQQFCVEPLFYRANTPLRLPEQKQTVRSQTPLVLTQPSGACARVMVPLDAWQIASQTRYLLPDVQLQFTPLDTVEPIVLRLSAGHFETFAHGQPFKQLLEYWATLLHCELEPLGWRAYRQGTSLCIEASPERAGWNLQGSFLFETPSPNLSKAQLPHLPLPLPFDSREQQAGQALVLTWGPYRFGNTRYACRLTYDPTWRLNDLQQAFQEALQMQGFSYDIQWQNGYLQLGFPAHLTLKKETPLKLSEIEHPFLALDLSPMQQRELSISFLCNHQLCQLEGALDSLPTLLQELQQQALTTGLAIALDDTGHLCFQSKDQQTPLILAELSESARVYLGISEVNESAPDLEYNNRVAEWQAWLDLAHQYAPLLHSEMDLQNGVEPFLNAFGAKDFNNLNDEAWQAAFQRVLDELDAWMLASEANASSPLWKAGLVSPLHTSNPGSLSQRLAPRFDKNASTSNFDHKI